MQKEMGTNMNFKGFGNDLPENFSLVRQPSVYSLTFDEFQATLGKEFGSMNMEELLKSIWSAEETQNTASVPVNNNNSGTDGGHQGNYLQRQGSLSLPRTLSLKTVDEVWKDIAKDYATGKDTGSSVNVPLAQTQREPTLGEITLEEFLVRAGVVREDNNANCNMGFGVGINLQQPNHGGGLIGSRIADSPPSVLSFNVNGVRSTQQQQQQQQQQAIFPKQSTVSCAPSVTIPSRAQLATPGIRGGVVGLVDRKINGNLGHCSVLQGGVGSKSPASLSSDGLNSNGGTPSVSPVPFVFNGGGLRGKKSNNTVEKVIERRHRRMIKNRESAARSRARKQAYTMELEQEVAKLKEENEELKKKQAEIIEMQKHQMLEMMDAQHGAKKRRLTKTLSGPW